MFFYDTSLHIIIITFEQLTYYECVVTIYLILKNDLIVQKVSCPSLKMSFALLFCLHFFIKLLLKFLFGELHFTNGSVVLYPPLTSWRKNIQFRKCLFDIWVSSVFNTGPAGYTEEEAQKLRKYGCCGLQGALYWL